MFRVLTCIATEHDWRLVILAAAICFLASLAAVNLLRQAKLSGCPARASWLLTAGAATGCGIWATHFIAMLAYNPGVPIGFDIGWTALSLIAAVALTGLGLSISLTHIRGAAALGGAVVGAGIAVMHYLGMWAVELPGRLTWSTDLVAVSVLLGAIFAAGAVTVMVRRDGLRTMLAATGLLTLAIVSVHFVAMGAVEVVPDPTRVVDPFSLSPTSLAWAIANAAMAVVGMSLAGAFAERRLRHRDQQFATAVNNMSQGVVMYDASERIVLRNARYLEMYNLSPEVVKPGCTFIEVIRERIKSGALKTDNAEAYREKLKSALAQHKVVSRVFETADGRLIHAINREIEDGAYWVGTHEDITDRKRAEARVAHMAHHDELTGMWNRTAFAEFLSGQLDRAKPDGEPFAVLCLDLDRFKEVNDVFGHAAGDALLREVSKRLQRAAAGAFLARLGGDEFILVSTGGSQPETAEALADRLLTALASDLDIEGQQLRIGLSVGIAVFPTDGEDATTLLGNADAALYRAKADGRGTIRFFEPEMDKQLRDWRALHHDLRSALTRNELALHYQPQAAMGGKIIGFEALARWRHPTRGLVPPNIFIPIAEESGLVITIGESILREACREAASWARPLQIAVNLSPVQFRHGDLVSLVHTVLLETGLPAHRLELEITEGVLLGDFDRALSILRRLKALGVRIAMDDFGTGYSSLSYLQTFPFDKIKIDRTFISNVNNNGQSAAIVRAVIGLGRGLDLPVTAEGVETQEQMKFLSLESCDEVQGFLIGRPMPIEHYAEMIGRPAEKRAELAAG